MFFLFFQYYPVFSQFFQFFSVFSSFSQYFSSFSQFFSRFVRIKKFPDWKQQNNKCGWCGGGKWYFGDTFRWQLLQSNFLVFVHLFGVFSSRIGTKKFQLDMEDEVPLHGHLERTQKTRFFSPNKKTWKCDFFSSLCVGDIQTILESGFSEFINWTRSVWSNFGWFKSTNVFSTGRYFCHSNGKFFTARFTYFSRVLFLLKPVKIASRGHSCCGMWSACATDALFCFSLLFLVEKKKRESESFLCFTSMPFLVLQLQ